MAKHYQRGGDRRGRPHGPSLGPKGDRLWLHGVHPVLAAIGNPDREIRRLLITADQAERLGERLEAALAARGGQPRPEIVERRALDNLLRDAVHQGIAAEADPLPEAFLQDIMIKAESRPDSLLVVLDQVTDPHNVGAVLRSAAAFGADAVVTTERHAPGETAALAKAAGYRCIGLEGTAEHEIDAISIPSRRALVLGAEGPGMRRLTRDSCDDLVRIPMAARAYGGGALESLNVSNAAAVALYALSRRRA